MGKEGPYTGRIYRVMKKIPVGFMNLGGVKATLFVDTIIEIGEATENGDWYKIKNIATVNDENLMISLHDLIILIENGSLTHYPPEKAFEGTVSRLDGVE